VFVNERSQPFGRMGIARMIERGGEVASLPFPIHAHMLRHSTGYALAAKGMDTCRLQHFLGHASITNTVRSPRYRPSRSRTCGARARSNRRPGELRNFTYCNTVVVAQGVS